VVIFVGFATFLGLLLGDIPYGIPVKAFGLPMPVIGGSVGVLATGGLAFLFIRIAVVTAALTIIIGVVNLLGVNIRRILQGRLTAKINSLVLILAFIIALWTYAAHDQTFFQFLLEEIQVPIESALAGLIFFSLVFGAFRILRNRVTPAGILFVLTVEIVLIGALPLPGLAPLAQVTNWLMRVPVNAGARGILLGIALATLVTGLRVLIGQDRTYGE